MGTSAPGAAGAISSAGGLVPAVPELSRVEPLFAHQGVSVPRPRIEHCQMQLRRWAGGRHLGAISTAPLTAPGTYLVRPAFPSTKYGRP